MNDFMFFLVGCMAGTGVCLALFTYEYNRLVDEFNREIDKISKTIRGYSPRVEIVEDKLGK